MHVEHHPGIYEGCCHIKEMDATKEQRLQEGEDDYVEEIFQ
jgi:hypothetical protein